MAGIRIGNLSIKARVTLFTFAVFTLLFWSLSLYASRTLRSDFQQTLSQRQVDAVNFMAAAVDQQLQDRLQALRREATQITPALLADRTALQDHLNGQRVLLGMFSDGVFVTDLQGTAIAAEPLESGRLGLNYLDRESVRVPLEQGVPLVAAPVRTRVGGVPAFGIGVPLRDDRGEVVGALVGVVDLGRADFLDPLRKARADTGEAYFLIARQERLIITSTQHDRIMQPLPPRGAVPSIDRFIDGFEGSMVYMGVPGVEQLASARRLKTADWGVAITLPIAEAFTPIDRLGRQLLWVTVALTALAGWLTWWMVRRQLSPVESTVRSLAQLARSDQLSSQSLPVDRDDEIGQLIAGFNHLISVLGEREDRLRASESKLSTVLEGVDSAIYMKDLEGRYQYVNRRFCELFGVSPAQVLSQTAVAVFDEDTARRLVESDDKVMRQGVAFRSDAMELRQPDGRTQVHLAVKLPLRDAAGQVKALVGVSTDITALRETEQRLRLSEERLRLLSETARDVVWTMSVDGRITYVSPVVEQVRGYTAEEAMQQGIEDIHTPASQEVSLRYFTQLYADLQAGRPPQTFRGELEYRCKDGSTYWAEVIVRPILAADGSVLEILGVSRDLSERKRYEARLLEANLELMRHRDHLDELVHERTRELARARDQAESASRAKSALLANVSHELRTPLNQIVGNAYLLAQDGHDPVRHAQAQAVVQASDALLRLVDNLIGMARLQSAEIDLEVVPFSLRELLARVAAQHAPALQAKGLGWALEIDPALGDAWQGDSGRLAEVLDKLLDNAVKFSDHGQVSLRCQGLGPRGARTCLRFEVRDQGPGLEASRQTEVFHLFEQGDGSSTRRHGGTGMGLAYARRLVALMGGEIGVESQPGQGSVFAFTVLLEGASPPPAPPEAPTLDPAQAESLRQDIERLLAEDDTRAIDLWRQARPALGALLGDRAEAFGQAVEGFDFSEALDLWRRSQADGRS
jgi:PAS domain S-box-containing protein